MPISTRPFMGATPYDTGTTFRVWAPFATAVAVAGNFNAWSATSNPLFPEGNSGYWSVDVPAVAVGAALYSSLEGVRGSRRVVGRHRGGDLEKRISE